MAAETWSQLEALLGREKRDALLRLAVDHSERGLAVIAGATEHDDDSAARDEAHRLRGALAPLGADAVTALLARIDGGEPVAPLLPQLRAAMSDFLDECRAALG